MYNELVIIFLFGGGLISLALLLSKLLSFNLNSIAHLKFEYNE